MRWVNRRRVATASVNGTPAASRFPAFRAALPGGRPKKGRILVADNITAADLQAAKDVAENCIRAVIRMLTVTNQVTEQLREGALPRILTAFVADLCKVLGGRDKIDKVKDRLCLVSAGPISTPVGVASTAHEASYIWAFDFWLHVAAVLGQDSGTSFQPDVEIDLKRVGENCKAIVASVQQCPPYGNDTTDDWETKLQNALVTVTGVKSAVELESVRAKVALEHEQASVAQVPGGAGQDKKPADGASTQHSSDFRSVIWFATSYTFTKNQAACVSVLWHAWKAGTPDLDGVTVVTQAGVDQTRLIDVFRSKGKAHPAWGTMLVQGQSKGAYRLSDGPASTRTEPRRSRKTTRKTHQ